MRARSKEDLYKIIKCRKGRIGWDEVRRYAEGRGEGKGLECKERMRDKKEKGGYKYSWYMFL